MDGVKEVETLLKNKKSIMMRKFKDSSFNSSAEFLNELSVINKILAITTKELIKASGKAVFRRFDGQINKNIKDKPKWK